MQFEESPGRGPDRFEITKSGSSRRETKILSNARRAISSRARREARCFATRTADRILSGRKIIMKSRPYEEKTVANNDSIVSNIISRIFGIVVFAIGVINAFWGNDSVFGIFIILLSLVYFLPAELITKKMSGFSIPRMGLLKIVLGVFILWAALGVGELFDKIDLMMKSLS
jgi:uncharacterized protein YjeT (DUF2065 family)